MCGRFVSATPPDVLVDYFDAQSSGGELAANFNVAPTSEVHIVRAIEGHRALSTVRWGLIPFWAKDVKIGSRLINARSETVAEKPAFRRAYAKRRCLIPADGFYEWVKLMPSGEGSKKQAKQPYFIARADEERLVFAGLWERWYVKDAGGSDVADIEPIDSCTILTCAPNREMSAVHDRMPVLLAPSDWDRWIAPESNPGALSSLLVPAPDNFLTLTAVTTAVNSVANNGPQLLEPLMSGGGA